MCRCSVSVMTRQGGKVIFWTYFGICLSNNYSHVLVLEDLRYCAVPYLVEHITMDEVPVSDCSERV